MKRCLICLEELDMFRGLEKEQFTNLCQCTNKKRLSKGHYLFYQGDITGTIFLVKSGKLKLVQSAEDGHETILDICGPGEVLGELSLYQEQKECSSALAMEEACICCFSKMQFVMLIKKDPSFALRIINYLGQKRYAIMNSDKETRRTVKERLLRLFYNLANQYGKKLPDATMIDLIITQQELADMIGSSRVMVIQALNELKEAKIVDHTNRYYILKDDPCLSTHIFK
ncbi:MULTISPECIES: Crp/Fnr family transcriptional regulator [Dehalobacter]|uniref:Cyclic nucleotide-binding domain-containing protein n=1 Tax=Dehalobacter restrictus TaxID=55583 RepID=A0A857DI58_9FIRM|nr:MULTISPECIES: Crp/Fnr family transcriptional regulator [Dehalobacter]MCG1026181.1 Crp/Fnr family transcriptional regulator [Dehalobacter sp.]OCZ53513.1 cyclic nucleotide-binding protein [Dehalobacter sp. TeCB1]OCZ53517.1 cyclic nucleotide-binding protein [Dehalobacter sp. TeCB1]QHA00473.1 cyclic nucleotide-binding domain-containing protein [Dehalobacter restrictus]